MTDLSLPFNASDDELAEFADALDPNLTPAEVRRAIFNAGVTSLTKEELDDVDHDLYEQQLQEALNNSTLVTVNSGWSNNNYGYYWMEIPELSIELTSDDLPDLISGVAADVREYGEKWETQLRALPKHARNEGFVQMLNISPDAMLKRWLTHHHNKNKP
jgi:hypothetical protein